MSKTSRLLGKISSVLGTVSQRGWELRKGRVIQPSCPKDLGVPSSMLGDAGIPRRPVYHAWIGMSWAEILVWFLSCSGETTSCVESH